MQCPEMGSFGLAIKAGAQWLENTPRAMGRKEGPEPLGGAGQRDPDVCEEVLRIWVSSTPRGE